MSISFSDTLRSPLLAPLFLFLLLLSSLRGGDRPLSFDPSVPLTFLAHPQGLPELLKNYPSPISQCSLAG